MRALGWLRRRPTLAAALLYAVLMTAFVGPALVPGKTWSSSDALWFQPPWVATKPPQLTVQSNPDLGDGPDQMELFVRHAAEEMPGHVPLWNPYIVGGRPWHGNDQSALFGPYTWPAYVLPYFTALGWIAALKLWVAAFGTYLLGRSLGMRFGGALLAGIAYGLSLKLVTWVMYPAMGVWTWYPWLLFAAERLVRRRDPLSAAGLATVVALQFLTGHPESSFQALVLTTAFFAFRLWQQREAARRARARLRRPLLMFAGAVAGGAAIAAISLIPFAELLSLSADYVDRRGESVDSSMPFGDAVSLFLPDFWGRPTQTPLRPIMLERAMYVGALPLMLAAIALILRPTRTRVGIALFGFLGFAVAVGIPPFLQIVTRLPVFNSGHNTRLIVYLLLALALLGGWGLDELSSRELAAGTRRRIVVAAAAVVLLVPVVIMIFAWPKAFTAPRGGLEIAWLFRHPPGRFREVVGTDEIRASALIIWLTAAGAGLLLIVLRLRGRLSAELFVALAVVFLCVDLFRIGMGQNPAIDRDVANPPATGAVRYLQRQGFERFVSTQEVPHNVIPLRWHLYEARGYDIPIVRRYDRLWRRDVVPGQPSVAAAFLNIPLELREVTERALRTLRLLGVTHILGPKVVESQEPPFGRLIPVAPLGNPGLRVVYDGKDARVYRLSGALPRAFVVGAQRTVGDDAHALDAFTDPAFDGRAQAITEQRLPGLPEVGGPRAGSRAGDARITRYEPERVVIRAHSSGQGLLVLSDNYYPGWKATVDGKPAKIERVDYLFRGVRVGPGRHTVEFTYEPSSWRAGWMLSLVSLGALGVVVVVGRRRRYRVDPLPAVD